MKFFITFLSLLTMARCRILPSGVDEPLLPTNWALYVQTLEQCHFHSAQLHDPWIEICGQVKDPRNELKNTPELPSNYTWFSTFRAQLYYERLYPHWMGEETHLKICYVLKGNFWDCFNMFGPAGHWGMGFGNSLSRIENYWYDFYRHDQGKVHHCFIYHHELDQADCAKLLSSKNGTDGNLTDRTRLIRMTWNFYMEQVEVSVKYLKKVDQARSRVLTCLYLDTTKKYCKYLKPNTKLPSNTTILNFISVYNQMAIRLNNEDCLAHAKDVPEELPECSHWSFQVWSLSDYKQPFLPMPADYIPLNPPMPVIPERQL